MLSHKKHSVLGDRQSVNRGVEVWFSLSFFLLQRDSQKGNVSAWRDAEFMNLIGFIS